MTKLPEDVAHECALMTQKLTNNCHIKVEDLHIDIAFKIVRANLLADTIKWYRYISGNVYE